MTIPRGHRFDIAFDSAFPQGLVLIGTVTDPDEPTAKRASFEVTFVADVQPVPATIEVLPGMRPIVLDGLTAEPRVAGNGEFKYQSYGYRATGFRAATAAGTRLSQSIKTTGAVGSGELSGKAA